MELIRSLINNRTVQGIAGWITVGCFTFFILKSMVKLMLSVPQIAFISGLIGLIGPCLIFSIHAYRISKRSDKSQNDIVTKVEALISDMKADLTAIETKLYSISTSVFPVPTWLTGQDLLRIYTISENQLKQHIFNGLPAYKTDIPVQFIDDKMHPMNEHDINFTLAYDDDQLKENIKGLLFKREDVLEFIKTTRSTRR